MRPRRRESVCPRRAPLAQSGWAYVANPFSLPVVIAGRSGATSPWAVSASRSRRFPNGSAATLALVRGTIDLGVSGHLQTLQAARGPLKQVFIAPLGFEEAPDHLPVALLAPGA